MKTKVLGWWLVCWLFLGAAWWAPAVQASPAGAEPTAAPILAPSYILLDVDTGRVLAAHGEHERRFPASTTKTMTALVALENGDLDRVVTIGPNPPKTGESSAYLLQGETFTLRELLEAALMKSANDSCVAIAEAVGGTVPHFVEMMNAKARALGAKDSHFVNPHGLHDPNHYTTAYDLALIARAALKYPAFNEIVSTREATIHGNAKVGAVRLLKNLNRLLQRWDECDGVKTGYTRQAGRCLIATATRVNPKTHRPWRLLSVVLHSPNSWQDSRNLLEHGFATYTPVVMARGGETLAKLDVEGGASQVQAVAAKEVRLPLRRDERAALTTRLRTLAPEAPVKKDQPVAQLEWFLGSKKIAEVSLVAREPVSRSWLARLLPVSRSEAAPMTATKDTVAMNETKAGTKRSSARWGVYGCAAFGILLISLGWKVRAHERKRERERARRYAARRLRG